MSINHKNQVFQFTNDAKLRNFVNEVQYYLGRDIVVNERKLEVTVLSLPKNYKKKFDKENRLRRQRRDRDSSYSIPGDDEYDEYEDRY